MNTLELIGAIAGGIATVIASVTALIVALRNSKKATAVANQAAQAVMVAHYYHDHISGGDLNAPGDSPETPVA